MPRKPRTPEQKLAEKLRAQQAAAAKKATAADTPMKDTVMAAPATHVLTPDVPPAFAPLVESEWEVLKQKAEVIWEAKAYREGIDTFAKLLVCLMRGAEIGIPPVQAATAIYLSRDGMPGMSAELMVACVMRSGLGTIQYIETSDTKAEVWGIRYGMKGRDDVTTQVVLTVDDLRRQGWTEEEGFLVRDTLRARAVSRLCRSVFADVLGGISYSPDEIYDMDRKRPEPKPFREIAEKKLGREAAARIRKEAQAEAAKIAAAAPEPPLDAIDVSDAPEPALDPADRPLVRVYQVPGQEQPVLTAGITLDQLRAVGELAQADPTLVPKAKAWMEERRIPDSKHLLEDEAVHMIEFMRRMRAFPGLTLERGVAELEDVIQEFGLTEVRDSVIKLLEQQIGKSDLLTGEPHTLIVAADKLRELAADRGLLQLVLERVRAEG